MKLRDYQIRLAHDASDALRHHGIVYLALECRVGKTLIALLIGHILACRRILFVTKKKAISSIIADYESFEFTFELIVCNYEQVAKVGRDFDLVIVDEAHSLGAFPRPSKRTRRIREIVGSKNLILMSGTPSPESYSQLYHQFWISERSPFQQFKTFYVWASEFVHVRERLINGLRIREYKDACREKIDACVGDLIFTYTQEQAGFGSMIKETIRTVPMTSDTQRLIDCLLTDRIVMLATGEIVVADTAVKLQSKVHQLCSGTVITAEGKAMIIDDTKAMYIQRAYAKKKIAIFYKYKAEAEILRAHFTVTESPEEFNQRTGLVFISQVRSGAMGVDLSSADVIVFYNIDFSSQLYWQARARMQSQERTKECCVDWIFSEGGIEQKIYAAVVSKKNYTTSYFKKDYGKKYSKTDYRIPA